MNFARFRRTIGFAALISTALIANTSTARADASTKVSHRPELRAFWVDGFNPGFITPQQCDDMMANIRAMHCNAVFVQMRKRGDAYYASHYEPWATDDTDHFDALDYLCKLAHDPTKPYIQVHAWINCAAVGGSKNPRGVAALHPEWHSVSDTGLDFDGESTKVDPGIPGAQDWTYRVYMDVVRHYPVDGIHLDFIRYGGDGKTVGHWGYSPVSVARYRAAEGSDDPTIVPKFDDPKWQAWRRRQVTNIVKRVYLGVKALRPKVIVSAATSCWGDGPTSDEMYEEKSAAYTDVFADWRGWMKAGILDMNCPMTYTSLAKHPTFWQHWCEFVKDHQYSHISAMGVGCWLNQIPNTIQEIQDTRAVADGGRAAAGAVLFSYAGTDALVIPPAPSTTTTSTPSTPAQPQVVEEQYNPKFYDALKAPGVWSENVPTPSMPWIDHPKLGHVAGVALNDDDNLTPMDQAAVTLRQWRDRHHHEYTHLTWETTADGNGFYGFPNIKPGIYDVRIDWHGRHLVQSGVAVQAGRVSTAPQPAKHRPVACAGTLPDGAKATYVGVIVTIGSDRLGNCFYIADKIGQPAVLVQAPNLVMPTVAGDVIAVSGIVHHTAGSPPVIQATSVRFLGAQIVDGG